MTELLIDVCNISRQTLPPVILDIKGQDSTGDEQSFVTYLLLSLITWAYALLHMFVALRCLLMTLLLALTATKLWGYYITSTKDATCSLPLPPGGFGFPLIGETIYFILFGMSFSDDRRRKYGDIFVTHLLGRPTIRVLGADNLKKVLRGEGTLVAAQWPESTRILLGNGSLAHATVDNYLHKKKAILRAFSFDALAQYVPVIQEVTQSYVSKWIQASHIMGYPEFKTLFFDLACRLLVGSRMTDAECERYLKVFDTFTSNIFSLPVDLPGSGLRKGKHARDDLLNKIDETITQRALTDNAGAISVLDIMLRSNNKEDMSEEEIKNMCLELLFAGHETTSSAAAYLVYALAKHPKVRKNLEAELTSHGFFGSGQENGREDLTMQTLNKLTYLNCVVKEVLRMSPPVGGGFRKALQTFELNGFQVPKGWTIMYGIRDTQSTEGYFPNKDVFNPDRWLENRKLEAEFKYLPFGGGRRSCAGKELAKLMLKIFALEMVRNCQWTLQRETTVFRTFPIPAPVDELPLKVSRKCAEQWK